MAQGTGKAAAASAALKSGRSAVASPQTASGDPKKIIEGYWDRRSESYGRSAAVSRKEEREVWMKSLSDTFSDLQPKKVLDVGAGTGFLSSILCEMGLDVTGIDLSRGMLTQAKESMSRSRSNSDPSSNPDHLNKRQCGYGLCQGDAEGLPFQSSSFDLVVSRHLLWTLPHPSRAIAEWRRILRPGGMMLAIDGNWFDPAISKKIGREISGLLAGFSHDHNPVPFRQIYKPIEKDLPLFQASRPDQCLALFTDAGLKNAKVDRLDDVNRFYKKNTSLSFRMANSDTVFMVVGERG